MKLVIQRVTDGRVTVDGRVVSEIGKGLMVLVGIGTEDTEAEMAWACQRILGIKLFADKEGKMWRGSVVDLDYEVLCVSQFTLYSMLKKNGQPDFHKAKGSSAARELYTQILDRLGSLYDPDKIKDGEFGAMMQVGLTNDGPVTITLDSNDDAKASKPSSLGPPVEQAHGHDTKRGAKAKGGIKAASGSSTSQHVGREEDLFHAAPSAVPQGPSLMSSGHISQGNDIEQLDIGSQPSTSERIERLQLDK